MKKRLFSLICCLMLLMSACFAIELPPEGTDTAAFVSEDAALTAAAQAALEEGIDFSKLPLLEAKATLVYDRAADRCQWIVCHFVEDEAPPYLNTTIDAASGEVLGTSRANYMEIKTQWEAERQLPQEFWPAEDTILFDAIYRKSVFYPRATLPAADDMTMEDAILLAQKTLMATFGLTLQDFAPFACAAQLMEIHNGSHHWFITYNEIIHPFRVNMHYQVTLDAKTGEIILCLDNANPGFGMAHRLRAA